MKYTITHKQEIFVELQTFKKNFHCQSESVKRPKQN